MLLTIAYHLLISHDTLAPLWHAPFTSPHPYRHHSVFRMSAFRIIDENGDGQLSREELELMLTNFGERMSKSEVQVRTFDNSRAQATVFFLFFLSFFISDMAVIDIVTFMFGVLKVVAMVGVVVAVMLMVAVLVAVMLSSTGCRVTFIVPFFVGQCCKSLCGDDMVMYLAAFVR